MILPRFLRKPRIGTISTLYGMIVAQARMPVFYRDYAVADTVNVRFELIVLHLALFNRRLASEPGPMRALGQAVFDLFCRDMDNNLREMGVGDLAVPKEMQRIGAAYYGRALAYDAALAAGDERALTAVIARNVHGAGVGEPLAARRLAAYMRACEENLAAQDAAALSRGALHYPDPAGVGVPTV